MTIKDVKEQGHLLVKTWLKGLPVFYHVAEERAIRINMEGKYNVLNILDIETSGNVWSTLTDAEEVLFSAYCSKVNDEVPKKTVDRR